MQKDVNTCKKYYITIDGREVEVSEQVYREYKRLLWREHKRKERVSRCSLGSRRCTDDCKNCQYLREGTPLSLDTMFSDGLDVADESCLEDVIELKMKIEALRDALNNLGPADRDIITGFANGESDRKIAERLNRPQTTISYRRKLILKQLRRELKDWE
jgi:DNA-directed RNA polymerase specialized sigma24 family protein